ncbi:MAG: extracellular solute-binding protein [Clostridia bacterium]|nr:extracellular solute-binding protein [Clostridia bacterium]
MKKVRTLSAVLALLMLLSMTAIFSSCKKKGGEEPVDTTVTQQPEATLSPLEVKDFGNREFKMLWPETLTSEGHFLHNELDAGNDRAAVEGNIIDKAVFTRNSIVENTYNVSIDVTTMKYSTIPKTTREEFAVGESSYSVIATVIAQMSPLAVEGILTDFNSLQYYDEQQEWWNHKVMQSLSVANKRYYGSGDIIYSDDLYPYVVYANTALAQQLNITENFYELVKDKEWTLEKFHELAALAYADNDGVDGISAGDRFGAVDGTSFARALYYSAGKGVISLDAEGYPTWQMTVEHADSVLTKIIRALHTDNVLVDAETKFGMKTAMEIMNLFNTNKMLFMPGDLKAAQAFTTMDNALEDFALLPIPLWNEDSEYICVMNDAVVLSIPVKAEDREDIGLLLSAMSRESVKTLTPAFFETVLTYRYMTNPESVELLQLILNSVMPRDVADIQGWGGFMSQFSKLAIDGKTDFSSYYDGNIGTARAKMDEYIGQLEKIDT